MYKYVTCKMWSVLEYNSSYYCRSTSKRWSGPAEMQCINGVQNHSTCQRRVEVGLRGRGLRVTHRLLHPHNCRPDKYEDHNGPTSVTLSDCTYRKHLSVSTTCQILCHDFSCFQSTIKGRRSRYPQTSSECEPIVCVHIESVVLDG